MIQHLAVIYRNPHRRQEAKHEYRELHMKPSQHFRDFKTQFIHLADEAGIPPSERFDDLFEKLPLPLQEKLLFAKHTLNGNFQSFCDLASGVDADAKRIATQKFKNMARAASTKTTTGTLHPIRNEAPTTVQTEIMNQYLDQRLRPFVNYY
jgi:hypothetical protein